MAVYSVSSCVPYTIQSKLSMHADSKLWLHIQSQAAGHKNDFEFNLLGWILILLGTQTECGNQGKTAANPVPRSCLSCDIATNAHVSGFNLKPGRPAPEHDVS
jgi:hypothetical protein